MPTAFENALRSNCPQQNSAPGTLPNGTEPDIFMGFKVVPAVYQSQGVDVALSSLVVENTDFGAYSPSDIIAGVGLKNSNPTFFGDALSLVIDGSTVVCTFTLPAGTGAGVAFEMVDSTDYNLDYFSQFRNGTSCVLNDASTVAEVAPLSAGRHIAALTMIDGEMSASIDGSAPFSVNPAAAWSPAPEIVVIGIGGDAVVEEIGLYPDQAVGDLPGLSEDGYPVVTAAPAITGTAQVGQTLSCSTGTDNAVSHAYQWRYGPFSFSIVGATSATYEIAPDYEGSQLSCMVSATNATGTTNTFSNATDAVIAA